MPSQDPLNYRSEILSTGELTSAIDNKRVTLAHIVMTRYLSQKLNNPDATPAMRADYNGLKGPLLATYDKQDEYLWYRRDQYFCSYIPAAVMLKGRIRTYAISRFGRLLRAILFTKRRKLSDAEIDMVYLPESTQTTDPEIEAAIWRGRGLYLAALQRRGERQSFLIQAVYSLLVYLLSLADAQAISHSDSERIAKAVPRAKAELNSVEDSIKTAAMTEARQDYLLGTFVGVIFLIALVALLFRFTSENSVIHSVLGIVAAGGLGATLSVMTRLTANRLRVDAGAGVALIRLAGSFRPVVGAVLGLALYSFIEAGLLPIKVTATGQSLVYFYLAVAFLAGFSERLAQDAITKAGGVIGSDGSPAEGPPEWQGR
jgi:hypothetical protein